MRKNVKSVIHDLRQNVYKFISSKTYKLQKSCDECPLGWDDTDYYGECYDCGCMVNDNLFWCIAPLWLCRLKAKQCENAYDDPWGCMPDDYVPDELEYMQYDPDDIFDFDDL